MDVAIFLAALLLITYVAWRRGARLVAVGFGLFALLPALAVLRQLPWWGYVLVGVPIAALVWHRYARSAGVVTRVAARSRRRAGVASTSEIFRHASPAAMRRRAPVVRPSLAGLSRRALWRLPKGEYAVELCRAGLTRTWAALEDVVLVFGGPRAGKSGWLCARLIDHPGAAVATSTRVEDLYGFCAPFRARRGPVVVFNAAGLGGIRSTISFDPLTGCTNPVTAMERATDMIGATSMRGGSGDREFWEGQARRVLAALLHAAALDPARSLRDVLTWLGDTAQAAKDVPGLLRRSAVAAFELDVRQFLDTNPNTRTSITSTVMPALTWLNHPAAAAAADPRTGRGFDVAGLVDSRATIYLLGGHDAIAAPLVTALTGHIAREARRIAVERPGGRLDPPLGMFLDEAFLICPVPLESWTADMGGRGVTIYAAFQGRAQVLSRWGDRDGATILNNAGSVMVFGGTKDRDDLVFWSTLAGERDEPITTTDMNGRVASRTVRKVPVVPPAQIAALPPGRVLLIRRGIAPVLGRATMAWRRPDVRWARWVAAHPAAAAPILHALAVARALRSWALAARRRHGATVAGALIGGWLGARIGTAMSAGLAYGAAEVVWWAAMLAGLAAGVGVALAVPVVAPPLWQGIRRVVARLVATILPGADDDVTDDDHVEQARRAVDALPDPESVDVASQSGYADDGDQDGSADTRGAW